MEQSSPQPVHFILIPLMAQGHIIPMADFGRCLAERGQHVTLVTTPFNAARLRPTADRIQSSGHSFELATLRLPTETVGLPEGCENAESLPDLESLFKFFEAVALLEEPFREHVRAHVENGPTCIVSDFAHLWTRHVSRELGIPRFVFYSVCCFTSFCHEILPGVFEREDDGVVVVPDVPHTIEVTKAQAPGFFTLYEGMLAEAQEAERTSDGIIVNTVEEVEPMYVEKYGSCKNKKIWTIGPVSLINKQTSDKAGRGSKSIIDPNTILNWLDTMNPKSVIYMNLGSQAYTPPLQAIEIGMGLEGSGHPFIWVIKSRGKTGEVEEWLKTSGFEERNKGKGIVINGWAPQVMILSHPSVGGFVTHCGWNSTMEGITAGLPMITWPSLADQFLNERFVVDVLGIGVSIGIKEPNWWWNEGVLVERGRITEVVKELMGGGKEADERRRRALEVGGKATRAMEIQGSSYHNITTFINQVQKLTLKVPE